MSNYLEDKTSVIIRSKNGKCLGCADIPSICMFEFFSSKNRSNFLKNTLDVSRQVGKINKNSFATFILKRYENNAIKNYIQINTSLRKNSPLSTLIVDAYLEVN